MHEHSVAIAPPPRWGGRAGAPFFIKRDDVSSPIYGGNKVRTLEALFGRARAAGVRRIYSTGAFGSNHALAAVPVASNSWRTS